MAIQAYLTAPEGKHRNNAAARKGLNFIRKDAKPDDGLYSERLGIYYQMMSKGLSAAGVDQLSVHGARTVDWRSELATKLLTLQKANGSWTSENGRWMEKDPNFVSTYSLLALNPQGGGWGVWHAVTSNLTTKREVPFLKDCWGRAPKYRPDPRATAAIGNLRLCASARSAF